MGRKELLQNRAMKQLINLFDVLAKLQDLKNKFGAKRIEEELLNLKKEKNND